jgi:uncharacterized RDD family membrane protein YckC
MNVSTNGKAAGAAPLAVAGRRSYFPELVGACPVAVGFAASPISGVVAAVGSGFFFTGPIVSGGARLSML